MIEPITDAALADLDAKVAELALYPVFLRRSQYAALRERMRREAEERDALRAEVKEASTALSKERAWNDLVFREATESVKRAGGIGEGGHTVDRLVFLDANRRKMEQRIAELREALAPFAIYADAVNAAWPDSTSTSLLFTQPDGSLKHEPTVNLGHCRRAAAAILARTAPSLASTHEPPVKPDSVNQ